MPGMYFPRHLTDSPSTHRFCTTSGERRVNGKVVFGGKGSGNRPTVDG